MRQDDFVAAYNQISNVPDTRFDVLILLIVSTFFSSLEYSVSSQSDYNEFFCQLITTRFNRDAEFSICVL